MTDSSLLRTATAADVPTMQQIRSAVRENRLSDPGRITDLDFLPFLAAGSIWVAETKERVTGFAALSAASGNVWALFVDPGAERQGIGRALHDHMLRWAHDHGLRHLWLTTGPATRAERFYRQSGWEEAGFTESGEQRFERKL